MNLLSLKLTILCIVPLAISAAAECADSPLRFETNKAGKYKNKKPGKKNCDWVGKEDHKEKRCNKKKFAILCPITCNKTDYCDIDSMEHFRVSLKKSNDEPAAIYWKTCAWVKENNVLKRCKKFGVKETCPDTCSGVTSPSDAE